jgi:hypothetical protein
MSQYLFYAFIAIVIYLVLAPGSKAKEIINSLSAANIGTILALQGRNAGGYTSSYHADYS